MRQIIIRSALFVFILSGCVSADRAPAFSLRDDNGRPWSLADQHQGVVLLFGYTHCPDTCPLMLAKLARAFELTKETSNGIEVAFVTVDPQRDTTRALRAYLSHFEGPFVGLTGAVPQIEAVERSYHIWAQRLPSKRGRYDYDEAHSSMMIFIDRDRNIASLHDPSDSVGELANAMQNL
jgi:protein SCO1